MIIFLQGCIYILLLKVSSLLIPQEGKDYISMLVQCCFLSQIFQFSCTFWQHLPYLESRPSKSSYAKIYVFCHLSSTSIQSMNYQQCKIWNYFLQDQLRLSSCQLLAHYNLTLVNKRSVEFIQFKCERTIGRQLVEIFTNY